MSSRERIGRLLKTFAQVISIPCNHRSQPAIYLTLTTQLVVSLAKSEQQIPACSPSSASAFREDPSRERSFRALNPSKV